MYIPDQYRPPNREAALDVLRAFPLATVVSVVDGSPFVSYLPMHVAATEPNVVLTGHCARSNPHWTYFERGPLLMIFRGPDGYISPRFSQDCAANVPTWNYIAVHCTGSAEIASPQETDAILRALVEQMESPAETPWRMDDLDADRLENLKKAIVAFTVSVTSVESKFKLSQRRSDGDIAGLLSGLRENGSENDRALADAMESADRWSAR